MNLFDKRFTWMQPTLWQRAYEFYRRAVHRDRWSGQSFCVNDAPHRIRRCLSATQIEFWQPPGTTMTTSAAIVGHREPSISATTLDTIAALRSAHRDQTLFP